MSAPLRVAVFGATGTAGSAVVTECLDDPRIGEVRAIARRPAGSAHEKLRSIVCDNFDDLARIDSALTGVDACFFCLGISQSQAESEAHYRRVTIDYAVNAARALRERSPDHTFHYLSGAGTDPTGRSWMMWARVKGEAENTLGSMGLRRLFCHRPGYIHPEQGRAAGGGASAAIGRALFPVLRAVAPSTVIRAAELARAMIEATMSDAPGGVLENRDLLALAKRHPRAAAP